MAGVEYGDNLVTSQVLSISKQCAGGLLKNQSGCGSIQRVLVKWSLSYPYYRVYFHLHMVTDLVDRRIHQLLQLLHALSPQRRSRFTDFFAAVLSTVERQCIPEVSPT